MTGEQQRIEFLFAVYELAGGVPLQGVLNEKLAEKLNLDLHNEFPELAYYLTEERLIKGHAFGSIAMTHEGRKLVERIMAERYEEKERRVLQKLYDERHRKDTHPYEPAELARELNIDIDDVEDIILELEKKGLTGGTDEVSWILPAGIKEIEKLPEPPRQSPINVMHIGTNYGAAAVGSNINQNVTLTNNPDFDRAIAGLLQLIQSSQLPNDEIEELQEEVVKLNKLALTAPKPGLLEKAKARIDFVKLGLEGTELLVKAAPLLQTAWDHFSK